MDNKIFYLINKLATSNNIKIDKVETKLQLLSHPFYPSLNCITDLFNHFEIDNIALKVENNLDTYLQLPNTFLAEINEDGVNTLVVVLKAKNTLSLIYSEKKKKTISTSEFLKLWSGVIVAIEKSENNFETKSNNVQTIRKVGLIISVLCLGGLFFSYDPTLFQTVHFLLSCFGFYASTLIIQKELGINNKIVDQFCSGESEKSDCDSVLDSKIASLFGLFKLSDVGLVYFATLIISWILIAVNDFQSISAIISLSVATVPFTFISIYYQRVIIKSWCPLCLTIVGILWLQSVTLFLVPDFITNTFSVDLSYGYLVVSLLITMSLWASIKPLLENNQELQKFKIKHFKFKRNFTLFKAALDLNPILDTDTLISNELIFGDKSDDNLLKIIVVTNPLCGYCKESHQLVQSLLNKKNPNVKIIIRFNVRTEDLTSEGTKISAKILELYHTTTNETCLDALADIYGDLDAKVWLDKWGEAISNEYIAVLKNEKEWCAQNKINFTPAVIVNGKEYPKNEYDKMDLLFFLDDLIEENKLQVENTLQPVLN